MAIILMLIPSKYHKRDPDHRDAIQFMIHARFHGNLPENIEDGPPGIASGHQLKSAFNSGLEL